MDFLSVSGENFMALENFYVELNDRGLIAVQGINNADSSTVSNGAGKSSLSDAVSWTLYGVTARGSSGDRVVNNHYKKNTKCVVWLDDEGTRYRVERYRKHETHKNQCFLFQVDAAGTEIDLSKGTDKETQLEIDRVVGANSDVFNAAIYAGQEAMPNLPGMTDKALKTLLEEASGTEELAECYKIARQEALTASKAIEVETNALNLMESSKSRTAISLNDAKDKAQLFEDGRRDRARAEIREVPAWDAEVAALKVTIEGEEKRDFPGIVADCDAKIAAVAEERNVEVGLVDAVNMAARKADRAEMEVKATREKYSRELNAAKSALENVSGKLGQPCSTCGKPYCEEDLETVTKIAQTAHDDVVARIRTDLPKVTATFEEVVEAQLQAKRDLESHQASMTDLTAVHNHRAAALMGISQIEKMQRQLTTITDKTDRAKNSAKAKLTEPNPNTSYVESFALQLEQAGKDIAAQRDKITGLEAIQEELANVVEVFGPSGVRAHILDLITPFLNDKTRDYLGGISDGNIHAVWSTLTRTAKGEMKEKFNIEVTNDKGGESFTELSGGEKRKVRLATALALQELVASRATKPINLFIADEIDDALDAAGLERLMAILVGRSRDCGTVLVISHNAISDWVPEIITVEKSGKLATVSGSTHRSM